ncbi:nucleotidyltransferase domain-containing protein [Streptomyces sp. WMMC500]|uniref:nucleotidyltransferase domain-containing protein n=1 Tax=Streptomyces sp. WMMC500 TaxID=3015154 RepID=UPI00248A9482|nr:nucleotidyltransferase domain-containing protein [Streptomyces sp. WMMC500]WBB64761.1 nucleotidyltransferase domain-containing protein [Streptomyces sp. WMMC500]
MAVHDAARPLLDRFLAALRTAVPLEALWAHGSLALGDYRPYRSDLDLIAVVREDAGADPAARERLKALHRRLHREVPLAAKLHCSYVAVDRLAGAGLDHLTWAHAELFSRPVTPVTRRELHTGALVLHGPGPEGLLPAPPDAELRAFIRKDLAEYWLPTTAKKRLWLRDVWVDLGPVTVARAGVTLREGRLITKGEALDVLAATGAPARLVADIRDRRYAEHPARTAPLWRLRRATLAREYVRSRIPVTLAEPDATA